MHHPHRAHALRRLSTLPALLALVLTGCIVESPNTEDERDGGGGAGAAGGAGAGGGAGGGGAGGAGAEGGAGGAGAQGGAGGAIGGSGGEGGAVGGSGGEGGAIGGSGGAGGQGGAIECDAEPACPPDRVQVAQCPADSNCVELTACGATIGCLLVGPCADVAPCTFDEVQIPFCPFEAERAGLCRVTVDCNQLAYCAVGTSCRAIPTCPEGTAEADDCAPGDPTCHWELLCNSVIACRPTEGCTCLPGTFPINGLCAPGDDFCLPRVGCVGDSAQPAPGCLRDACGQRADLDLCPEGHRAVPACADNGHPCTEGIACGEPYACESPVSCLNPCPEGIAQVPACSGDDQYTCIEVPECNAFCEGPAE